MTLPAAQSLLSRGDRQGALALAARLGKSLTAPQDLTALARFYTQAREHRAALSAYEAAWQECEGNVSLTVAIHIECALIYRYLGNKTSAEAHYRDALKLDPAAAAPALKGLSEMGCDVAQELQAAQADIDPHSQAAALLYFAISKSCHDVGDKKLSWRYLEHANKISRSLIDYDPAIDRDLMFAIRYAFSDIELFDESQSDLAPIFILGLPRTGTTLLERILSSHPQVDCGGELTAMPQALARYGGVDARTTAAALSQARGVEIAADYARIARGMGIAGNRPWTDKQCLNFLYCPLLLRAFPRASLISIERHPLATVYAMYRQHFPGHEYPFAYDLTELADFYIGRARLMEHWRAVLPARVIRVRYEDLIERFDETVRGLLSALKLPFDMACLAFDKNPAPVLTMSAEQVREPLYRSSLEAWRQYVKELKPARARLEAAGIDCQ